MPQTFTIPDYIRHEAEAQGLDPAIALAIAEKESSFNPAAMGPEIDQGGKRVRAIGTYQLLPETARMLGVDPSDPQQNIQGGIKYLKQLLEQHGDPYKALGAYGGVKTDTTYVPDALARIKKYQLQGAQGATVGTPPPTRPGTTRPGDVPIPASMTATSPADTRGFDEKHPTLARIADAVFPAQEEAVDALQNLPTPEGASTAESVRRAAERAAVNFSREATTSLNPINIYQGVKSLLTTSPLDTLRNMAEAHRRVWDEGQKLEDMGQGIAGRLRKSEAVIPLFGPRIAEADKWAREGEYARAAGAVVDVAGQTVGPKFLEGSRVTPRVFKPRITPETAAAVRFGMAHNVPVDVATASGSRFARNVQAAAEATPIGGAVHEAVSWARQQKLPVLGEELASRVHPTPVSPAQAGAELRTGVERYIADQHATANGSYDALRQIEASAPPTQVQIGTTNQYTPQGLIQTVPIMGPMQLPADLTAAKAALRPVAARYAELIGTAQADASPGLRAIKQILDGPDFMPASQLDANLSVIKGLGRGADLPQLRSVSQGLASQAVKELEAAHSAALAQAGPAAQQAMTAGRTATAAKYAAQEILDKLREEPVGTFRSATYAGDAAIEHLTDLGKIAPQELPRVGRAVLEDIFDRATGLENGWGRAASVANKWEQLGPQTKQLLYGSHVADLDKFFLLQKKLAELANPSRTALVGTSVASLGAVYASPFWGLMATIGAGGVAGLMNSRLGVRLLTEGLTIPTGTAQAAAWHQAVINQLHRAGDSVGLPPPTLPGRAPANAPPPEPPR